MTSLIHPASLSPLSLLLRAVDNRYNRLNMPTCKATHSYRCLCGPAPVTYKVFQFINFLLARQRACLASWPFWYGTGTHPEPRPPVCNTPASCAICRSRSAISSIRRRVWASLSRAPLRATCSRICNTSSNNLWCACRIASAPTSVNRCIALLRMRLRTSPCPAAVVTLIYTNYASTL